MSDQLEAVGVKPLIAPDLLYGAMVLTLDQVLPPGVDLSPPQVAALGTTAITVQRFLHRRKIAAAIAAGAGMQPASSSPAPVSTGAPSAPSSPSSTEHPTPAPAAPAPAPAPPAPVWGWDRPAEDIVL